YFIAFLFGVGTGFASARLTDHFRSRDQRHEGARTLIASAATLLPRLTDRKRHYDGACADGDAGREAYFRSVELMASESELQELRRALAAAPGLPVPCRRQWSEVCEELETVQKRHEEIRLSIRLSEVVETAKTGAYRQRLDTASGAV